MTPYPASLLLVCAAAFTLASVLARLAVSCSVWQCAVVGLFAAYAPTYVDGSEYDPLNWRYSPAFARLSVWRRFASYFSGRVLYEATRPEYEAAAAGRAQFVLAVHPHGVVSWNHGLFFTDSCGFLSTGPLAGLMQRRDLAAAVLFRIPLFRDLLLALGCVDASAATCHRVLQAGLSMQLYVGGEREQMLTATQPEPVVVARERRGFIRLALQYGLPVIPCYVFNEDRLYHTSRFLLPLRLALVKAARIALPLAYGRYWWLPLVPRRKELLMVVGRPLQLEGAGQTVTDELVQAALSRYCDELTALFDRHKGQVKGYESARLKIV